LTYKESKCYSFLENISPKVHFISQMDSMSDSYRLDPLPSIVEVARRAGVSLATASRVLSNANYTVSAPLRQRVLSAAAELHYVPNPLARSLKGQRNRMLAVMVGNNADPYFAEIARGIEEVVGERGYLTIVCNSDRNPTREMNYLRLLETYRIDGVLFVGSGSNNPVDVDPLQSQIQKMQARGAVVVTLTQHPLSVPTIQPDNFTGTRLMTEYLLKLGHRRIAFIGGPPDLLSVITRQQGYLAAFASNGIDIDPTLLLSSDFTLTGGEIAARTLLALPAEQRPTAIFAGNDEMAYGVYSALRQAAIPIPSAISICGFDDLPMSALIAPALTTVHIPLRELGREGAKLTLALLQGEPSPDPRILPLKVIARDSTGPAPHN
jgi:LacI family transcriptional regulator